MNTRVLVLTLALTLAGGSTLALAQVQPQQPQQPPQPQQPVTAHSLEINSLKSRIEGYREDISAFSAAIGAEQKLLEADIATLTQLQAPPSAPPASTIKPNLKPIGPPQGHNH